MQSSVNASPELKAVSIVAHKNFMRINLLSAALFVIGLLCFYAELKSQAAKVSRQRDAQAAIVQFADQKYKAERPMLEVKLGPVTINKLDATLRHVKQKEQSAKE